MRFFFFSNGHNDNISDTNDNVKPLLAVHDACDPCDLAGGGSGGGGGDIAVASDSDSGDEQTLEVQARKLERLNRSLAKIR